MRAQEKFEGFRVALFRVLGGALLLFAVVLFASAAIGTYVMLRETSSSGWVPPILIGSIAIAALLLGIFGVRVFRVTSTEQLAEQSKSKWLEPPGEEQSI